MSSAILFACSWHKDYTLPSNGETFVFGSNLAGRHGKGSAKVALSFGACYGQGEGVRGRSYAIPTKGLKLEILPLDSVQIYVQTFLLYAAQTRKNFFVTRVGCGLAGHSDSEMAKLFLPAFSMENMNMPIEWKRAASRL